MDTTDIILRATGLRSVRALAQELNIPPATLNRQLRENSVQLSTMLAICRRFDVDLVELLVMLGHLDVQEAGRFRTSRGLESYSELELAGEMYRRAATNASVMPRVHH